MWFLKARPILGNTYPEGGETETVWSRASSGETLPGVATPLTWSLAAPLCERGLRKAFAIVGRSVPRGTKLVASVLGRSYLNLTSFVRLAAQVPGLDPQTILELCGGSEREVLARQVAEVSKPGFYARLPITVTRLLAAQERLGGEVERFDDHTSRVHHNLREMDFSILPDDALSTTLRASRKLFDQGGELLLSCTSAVLASHLALKTVLARSLAGSLPDGSERLAQALVSGLGDLESAQLAIALSHVAAIARHDDPARVALERGDVATLSALPEGPTKHALAQFFAIHGDRALFETELESPRFREIDRRFWACCAPRSKRAPLISWARSPSQRAAERAR